MIGRTEQKHTSISMDEETRHPPAPGTGTGSMRTKNERRRAKRSVAITGRIGKMLGYARSLELFSFRPVPRYRQDTYGTNVGVFMTLVVVVIILLYIIVTVGRFLEGNISVSSVHKFPKAGLDQESDSSSSTSQVPFVPFSISLVHLGDTRFFTVLVEHRVLSAQGQSTKLAIPLQSPTPSRLEPQPSAEVPNIFGDCNTQRPCAYLRVKIFPCQNTTQNLSSCATMEEIDAIVNTNYLRVNLHTSHQGEVSQSTREFSLKSAFSFRRQLRFDLRKTIVHPDYVRTWKKKSFSELQLTEDLFSIDRLPRPTDGDDTEMCKLDFGLTGVEVTEERNPQTSLDLIGSWAAFYSAVFGVVFIFMLKYNHWVFYSERPSWDNFGDKFNHPEVGGSGNTRRSGCERGGSFGGSGSVYRAGNSGVWEPTDSVLTFRHVQGQPIGSGGEASEEINDVRASQSARSSGAGGESGRIHSSGSTSGPLATSIPNSQQLYTLVPVIGANGSTEMRLVPVSGATQHPSPSSLGLSGSQKERSSNSLQQAPVSPRIEEPSDRTTVRQLQQQKEQLRRFDHRTEVIHDGGGESTTTHTVVELPMIYHGRGAAISENNQPRQEPRFNNSSSHLKPSLLSYNSSTNTDGYNLSALTLADSSAASPSFERVAKLPTSGSTSYRTNTPKVADRIKALETYTPLDVRGAGRQASEPAVQAHRRTSPHKMQEESLNNTCLVDVLQTSVRQVTSSSHSSLIPSGARTTTQSASQLPSNEQSSSAQRQYSIDTEHLPSTATTMDVSGFTAEVSAATEVLSPSLTGGVSNAQLTGSTGQYEIPAHILAAADAAMDEVRGGRPQTHSLTAEDSDVSIGGAIMSPTLPGHRGTTTHNQSQ